MAVLIADAPPHGIGEVSPESDLIIAMQPDLLHNPFSMAMDFQPARPMVTIH